MNIRNLLLPLLLFTGSLAIARYDEGFTAAIADHKECFADKSLEELNLMAEEYLKSIKQTPEWQKTKVAKELHEAAIAKLSEAQVACRFSKIQGWTSSQAAWLMGYSEKDCDLVEAYEKEYKRTARLMHYADKQVARANPELKALCKCIKKREYEALEILEKTV